MSFIAIPCFSSWSLHLMYHHCGSFLTFPFNFCTYLMACVCVCVSPLSSSILTFYHWGKSITTCGSCIPVVTFGVTTCSEKKKKMEWLLWEKNKKPEGWKVNLVLVNTKNPWENAGKFLLYSVILCEKGGKTFAILIDLGEIDKVLKELSRVGIGRTVIIDG